MFSPCLAPWAMKLFSIFMCSSMSFEVRVSRSQLHEFFFCRLPAPVALKDFFHNQPFQLSKLWIQNPSAFPAPWLPCLLPSLPPRRPCRVSRPSRPWRWAMAPRRPPITTRRTMWRPPWRSRTRRPWVPWRRGARDPSLPPSWSPNTWAPGHQVHQGQLSIMDLGGQELFHGEVCHVFHSMVEKLSPGECPPAQLREPGTIQAVFQGAVKKDGAPALWALVFHVQPQWLWMFVSVYNPHV